jgi:hypothetical protein
MFCSSCGEPVGAQSAFCSACGSANGSTRLPVHPRLQPARHSGKGILKTFLLLGVSLAVLLFFVAVVYQMTPEGKAATTARKKGEAYIAAQHREAEPKQSSGEAPSNADIGETMGIVDGKGFWLCGSSTEAFDEMMKWAVRGDSAEVKRTMRATGSIGLTPGLRVKILDIRFGKRKVRVLGQFSGGRLYSEDPRTGRECWVPKEALVR